MIRFRYNGEVRHVIPDPVEPYRGNQQGTYYLIGREVRKRGRFSFKPRSYTLGKITDLEEV